MTIKLFEQFINESIENRKIAALAKFAGIDLNEIELIDGGLYSYVKGDYRYSYFVYTDEEATDAFHELQTTVFDNLGIDAVSYEFRKTKDFKSCFNIDILKANLDGQIGETENISVDNLIELFNGIEELYKFAIEQDAFDIDKCIDILETEIGRGVLANEDGKENKVYKDGYNYYIFLNDKT